MISRTNSVYSPSMPYSKLYTELELTLRYIRDNKPPSFSGIGVIVCDDLCDHRFHTSIFPQHTIPEGLGFGSENLIEYLLSIGSRESIYHDGFMMFNTRGDLRYVAQYVSPPIDCSVEVLEGHGARYLTAILTSKIPGVIACGIVSAGGIGYVFKNGEVRKLEG